MLDATDFLNIVKKASIEALNASQPSDFCFGKVISTDPLKILVEQKMTLGTAQLVLTKNVTDYKVKITLGGKTDDALANHTHRVKQSDGNGGLLFDLTSEAANLTHSHSISGKKEMTIHNALQVNDEVILLKKKGGQKYLVLDRVVNT